MVALSMQMVTQSLVKTRLRPLIVCAAYAKIMQKLLLLANPVGCKQSRLNCLLDPNTTPEEEGKSLYISCPHSVSDYGRSWICRFVKRHVHLRRGKR